MAKVWVLYNPKCSSGKGKANAEKIESVLRGKDIEYIDVTTIDDMDAYISSLSGARTRASRARRISVFRRRGRTGSR